MKARPSPPPARPSPWRIAAALAAGTLAVFWPVTGFQFVNYDDTDFVTANPIVQAGLTPAGFKWVWHSEVARNWHPVTMLSHMFDCQLFGLQPWWPHLVNLLLHAASAVLLFFLWRRMTGADWRSALVAALFAWHPLHVESVAWVAERKDVLSTLFWFLTTWAYVRHAGTLNRKFYYALSLLFFALGLMSKPMLVTVPFTLLLLDYWPLARLKSGADFGRLAAEKIPFFAMSAAVCVVTYRIQQAGGAVLRLRDFPLSARIGNALVSYVRYIEKMFWPRDLTGLYLRSDPWPGWVVALAAAGLLAVSVLVLAQRRHRPYLAVGWFWCVGTLVPVSGLVQVGMQSMADRYTYVPLVGLFVIVAWGGWELAGARGLAKFAPAAASVALAICAALAVHQELFWRNSETLFKRMIDVMPANYMAHYNLGNYYAREHRTNEAIANLTAAIEEEPAYAEAHNNLGGILLDQKRYDEAIAQYRVGVQLHPEYLYYFNLANTLADAASARHDTNQFAEAVATYRQALRLNPAASDAHHNLGLTWQSQGQAAEAISEFEQAARLDSSRVDSWMQLGFMCASQNRMPEAERAFREIIRVQPGNADACCWLGNALGEQNKLADAIPFYLTALKLDPAQAQTEFNLALTFSRLGRRDEAVEHYRQALRINPNCREAQTALRQLESASGSGK
ncbi:MAG TPA: tetratricopeptide repeat protein [Verrucomicrobiae bacterium]|jgi:tetratricopeptide (TPR) repeat protein